uniref:Uncharacterized protein n=1 Tax=Paracoccus marcusii TaxID=59779 RepID=J7K713_9RHOB|nr:hypothetical protein [Paracoccus marcusii]
MRTTDEAGNQNRSHHQRDPENAGDHRSEAVSIAKQTEGDEDGNGQHPPQWAQRNDDSAEREDREQHDDAHESRQKHLEGGCDVDAAKPAPDQRKQESDPERRADIPARECGKAAFPEMSEGNGRREDGKDHDKETNPGNHDLGAEPQQNPLPHAALEAALFRSIMFPKDAITRRQGRIEDNAITRGRLGGRRRMLRHVRSPARVMRTMLPWSKIVQHGAH